MRRRAVHGRLRRVAPALGLPGRYVSANSHSSAVHCGSQSWKKPADAELRRVFGRHPRGADHDLVRLARRAKATGRWPRLRIDCGVDDFLIAENRRFHAALEKRGLPHEYAEFPGAHNWDYWDEHVRDALAFHARALRLKPST